MKLSAASIVIALASVLQISGMTTHEPPPEAGTETATGKVASSKGSLLVLELESGGRRLFVVSETTLAPAALLKAGDRVRVKYRTDSRPVDVLELVVLLRADADASFYTTWQRFVE